jgi:hypothetical protein
VGKGSRGVNGTEGGGDDGGRDEMNKSVVGQEVEVEVALARRLLAMYHNLFAHPAIANVDGELGPERQGRALIAALGALLSYSSAAKEYALSVGFPDVVVSCLGETVRHLSLRQVHQQWTSDQKIGKDPSSTKLRASARKTSAWCCILKSSLFGVGIFCICTRALIFEMF